MAHYTMSADQSGRALRTPRAFALFAAVLLIASYLGVLYYVVDVTGSVPLFVGVVLGSGVLATLAARTLTPRVALGVASALLFAGLGVYVYSVPAVYRALGDVGRYVGELLSVLSGRSVLLFLSADLWATAIAPAAVFLPWYLALRARYDAAAAAGGLALGFFVLTGDAGYGQTLLGVVGVFGLLGFGQLDRANADWSRVRRFGLWVVVVALATRAVSAADPFPKNRADGPTGSGTGGSDGPTQSLEGSLTEVDERVQIRGAITLTAEERFTIEADRPALWHAAAYDRYTGRDWLRTGGAAPFDGQLAAPPGETTTLRQRVTVEAPVQTMPAAWKATEVEGAPETARVSDLGGLLPGQLLLQGDGYVVESQVPVWSPERLRQTGAAYPDGVEARYTRLPSSTPDRVATLGSRLAEGAETPYDVAVAVEQWLETTKEYSLSVASPGRNAAATFIFEMDAGYCVHFATAMTVLLRTQGIPARFAVGYTPGEQLGDGRWLVRGLHSHSWVEVYFPDVGWVPFDPTPGSARETAEQEAVAESDETDERTTTTTTTTTTSTTNRTTNGSSTNQTTNGSGENGVTRQRLGTLRETTTQNVVAGGEAGGSGALPNLDGTGGSSGGKSVLADRDRVAALTGGAAVLLGAYQTGLFERGYRTVWARYQPRTDDPAADVERAVARAAYALGERYRERREGETFRAYVTALRLSSDERERAERLLERYEQARYADDVSEAAADEAVALADELVRGVGESR